MHNFRTANEITRTDTEELTLQFDREALNRLLSLGDRELKFVITKLAAENGIDLSGFNVSADDIAGARRALSEASDEEIAQIAAQIEQARRTRGSRGMRG